MFGNVIDGQLGTSGLQGQGAVLSLLFLLVLITPMIYYVMATNRSSRWRHDRREVSRQTPPQERQPTGRTSEPLGPHAIRGGTRGSSRDSPGCT